MSMFGGDRSDVVGGGDGDAMDDVDGDVADDKDEADAGDAGTAGGGSAGEDVISPASSAWLDVTDVMLSSFNFLIRSIGS